MRVKICICRLFIWKVHCLACLNNNVLPTCVAVAYLEWDRNQWTYFSCQEAHTGMSDSMTIIQRVCY